MKRIIFLFVIGLAFTSCQQSSSERILVSSEDIEAIIKDLRSSNSLENEKVNHLILNIDSFVVQNKNDEKAPQYLELKAKYLTALGLNKESLEVYKTLYEDYDKSPNHAEALFMMAFIYETNLNDKPNAELHYQKYINEFPNGIFYRDAHFALDNMNKTPEEIIEMFRKMNEDSTTTRE